jgi:hypothetical protein
LIALGEFYPSALVIVLLVDHTMLIDHPATMYLQEYIDVELFQQLFECYPAFLGLFAHHNEPYIVSGADNGQYQAGVFEQFLYYFNGGRFI